jgi:glucose-1-phosphate thymidylyltransferase
MRGIILAGGLGTRLYPLTLVANKHALPIYDRPMAFHIIEYMKEADITNIMVITGREHCGDLISLIGSGRDLGVEVTYRVQEDADGIAGALRLCEDFAQKESVIVVLGDNLLENGIKPIVDEYAKQGGTGSMIAVTEVEDPERFGVAVLKEGRVVNLIEKPKEPETNLAVIGVYIYDKDVWTYLPNLSPSARGEYEITDVNKIYMNSKNLHCTKVKGWWHDAGTIESMCDATILMRELRRRKS